MNSRTTRRFRDLFAALPEHVARQAREAYRLFRGNPSHPGLQFKQVHSDPRTYSARVGISYRALGVLEGDTVIWFWIGTHAELAASRGQTLFPVYNGLPYPKNRKQGVSMM